MTHWLRHMLPCPRLFTPRAPFPAGRPAGVAVLTPGPLPSADYYFRARAQVRTEGPPLLWLDTRATEPTSLSAGVLDGMLAVIVRHAPRPWLLRLEADAARLSGTAFFLDDDLPGAAGDPLLPRFYALRTSLRYLAARPHLERLCGQVWVSTQALRHRYPEAKALVLPPVATHRDVPTPPDKPLTVFYHGTAAHSGEKRWLAEVAAAVQTRCVDCVFEVSGGPEVSRLYQDIPRVRVLPPLSWPEFAARVGHEPLHIGLAPLLDSPFNSMRSHTKFLEISSCGAVGVYTRAEPYTGVVEHGVTGLLVDNHPQAWAEAVLRLAHDPDLRQRMAAAARDWCLRQPVHWPWEAA